MRKLKASVMIDFCEQIVYNSTYYDMRRVQSIRCRQGIRNEGNVREKHTIKVCIVGGGKIGYALAGQLSEAGCEVTCIDNNLAVINHISNVFDIICYQGNGASYEILEEAGIGECDIFIAVTGADELNILSCLTAHKLGAKNTIARVRNIDYAMRPEFYRENFGLSMTINPELATASEINRLLHFPQATRIELFAKGRAELVEMKVEEGNAVIGKSLYEFNKTLHINLLICAVVRDNAIQIPSGDFVILTGDILYITGSPKEFKQSFRKMKIPVTPVNSVMIAGASRIGYYLAKMLVSENVKVTVVESSHAVTSELAGAIPGISVMNSDAMEYFTSLSSTDIKNIDACVALTNNDEYNLIMSMYANTKNVQTIITKMDSLSALRQLQEGTKICTVSKEDAATNIIAGYARSLMAAENMDSIESMYRLMDGKLEFIEFLVKLDEDYLKVPLKNLKLKSGLLIACITRGRQIIIPRGDDVIQRGDCVLVVTVNQQITCMQDIFQ